MGAKLHLKIAMMNKELKISDLADRIGMKEKTLRVKLSRDAMSWNDAERLADAMGCDIVLRDRKSNMLY